MNHVSILQDGTRVDLERCLDWHTNLMDRVWKCYLANKS